MQVSTDKTIDGTVLSFYANEDTEYTLTLTKSNLDDYRNLHLIDLAFTRTSTPLTEDITTYHFTADSKGMWKNGLLSPIRRSSTSTAINLNYWTAM